MFRSEAGCNLVVVVVVVMVIMNRNMHTWLRRLFANCTKSFSELV